MDPMGTEELQLKCPENSKASSSKPSFSSEGRRAVKLQVCKILLIVIQAATSRGSPDSSWHHGSLMTSVLVFLGAFCWVEMLGFRALLRRDYPNRQHRFPKVFCNVITKIGPHFITLTITNSKSTWIMDGWIISFLLGPGLFSELLLLILNVLRSVRLGKNGHVLIVD